LTGSVGSPTVEAVSPRRAPSWLVRATATAAVVTLAAGLTTAASLEPPRVGAAEPVVSLPVEELRAAPQPQPLPPPPPAPAKRSCTQDDEPEQCLGPPPGPQADRRPERVAPPEARFAFLAGVTDYRPPTVDTIGAENDVQVMRQLLLDSGWPAENIRVVTDGQVTGRALREGMAWLAGKGQPGTFSLFHFSGHVKQLGGGTEALWPVDRDWVRDRDVTAALSQIRGKAWVDIAGCEAGSFLPGLPTDDILVSASSRDVEKSYEHPDWGMSVWSHLVLELGTRQLGADADGDRRVTIGEALRYATYYAQVVTWSQRPHGRQIPQVQGDPVLGWTLADPPA
jgi:hypothetical protein